MIWEYVQRQPASCDDLDGGDAASTRESRGLWVSCRPIRAIARSRELESVKDNERCRREWNDVQTDIEQIQIQILRIRVRQEEETHE